MNSKHLILTGTALCMSWVLLTFTGCESNTLKRSKKGIEKSLQGTWKRTSFQSVQHEEFWTFANGKVEVRYKNAGVPDPFYGNYVVDITMKAPYLAITGFEGLVVSLNYRYTILDINKETLVLVVKPASGNGLIQSEFIRVLE